MVIIPVITFEMLVFLLTQAFIIVFGLLAAYMSFVSKNPKVNKLAPIVALFAQPFWLYSTIVGGLWGAFFVCLMYTVVYAYAAYKNYYGGQYEKQ